ncbi:DUF6708 domain-containing protein [Burkholderia cepacia]|uniref:DUF6708 domain-containing protein n=1 Tax=Burkholderia cepacia TaxID=292 RepID=UPI001CE4AC35|nr:DUF6708 domain-containing protein [Burkholderia cepacia]
MAKPRLNPPCPGWQRDLPSPDEAVEESPFLRWLAPTHIDATYAEFARNTSMLRGALLCFCIIVALVTCDYVIFATRDIVESKIQDLASAFEMVGIVLMHMSVIVLCIWSACSFYRASVSPPRDLPLRFNRLRRKVYVYDFHSVWWNPFTRWYVTTASYDWDDLRAEKWKVRGATAGGAPIIKEGVSIAVVKPGTDDVITRFALSSTSSNTTNLWAYVCSYMQNGIEGLVPDHARPRDPNDVAPYNLALRLAPKVEWPTDMDHESRTAP